MIVRRALLLLSAGGLVVVGCSSDSGARPCADGQPCSIDGGADGGSDGGPPATCGSVQPCGGDVVGNWTFVEDCESAASFAAAAANFSAMAAQSWCPGQTLVGREPIASGSLVFDPAGTYSLDIMFGGSLDINFPASCLAGSTCDDATAAFQTQIADGTYPMPNVTSIACAGSSSCLCHAAVDVRRSETGTYSLTSSALTFMPAAGAVNDKSYCVVGSALHILDTSLGSMGQTNVDSDLVGMRQ